MVKPVSPLLRTFLRPVLEGSSEEPFTSPTGRLKPSIEFKGNVTSDTLPTLHARIKVHERYREKVMLLPINV